MMAVAMIDIASFVSRPVPDHVETGAVRPLVQLMRIVSSSPETITLATPAAELIVGSVVALCLLGIGITLAVASVPPQMWWSCRIGGGTVAVAGLAVLLSAKYRRWTFDGARAAALIETYCLLGRSRRIESDIEGVCVQVRSGIRGRKWNWFVLRKKDGAETDLGPTGHGGLDGAQTTVAAIHRVLQRTTGLGGESPD